MNLIQLSYLFIREDMVSASLAFYLNTITTEKTFVVMVMMKCVINVTGTAYEKN